MGAFGIYLFIRKQGLIKWCGSSLLLAFCLGIYQALLPWLTVLVCFYILSQILNNNKFLLKHALHLLGELFALFILAGPLLATLIYHGAFTVSDVIMTRKSLWVFSVGLPGFMLVKILASAFYSRQNIKTPVKIAVVTVGVC